MFKFISLLIIISFSSLEAKDFKPQINFSILPIKNTKEIIEEFIPLFEYLENKLSFKTNFVVKKDYADIVQEFADGNIDLALFGPLPYIKLDQIYKHNRPIVLLNQKDGNPLYRCVLVKFGRDSIDFETNIKVSLTQPLSTCGFYMTNILLQRDFNKNLSDNYYDYAMSHTNALLKVLEGKFQVAGAKESIANSFYSVGLRVISKSEYLPGF